MSKSQSLDPTENPSLYSFSATGRPFIPPTTFDGFNAAANSLCGAESWGAGPPNLNPVRFTDDSIISVPVLPANIDADAVQTEKKPTFWRRRSSAKKPDFVIKQMTRREYLDNYAKDDQGRYVGRLDPAKDCILRVPGDLARFRGGDVKSELFREGVLDGSLSSDGKADGVVR